ncbi:hypothetical protein [Streptomyces griseoaurantiacus]|uniref:hypothetical protein n=1 Tax=Streptomyces griseoaurantiacus TaxID=68213 RepID=UPI0036A41B3A
MNQNPSQLRVTITVDPGTIADGRAIENLRADFLEVDGLKKVEAVTRTSNYTGAENPKSSTSLGVMGLTLTIAPFALKQVAAITSMWLDRQKARTIKIEVDGEFLELSATSNEEQVAALELFLARHTPQQDGTDAGNS